MKIATYCCIVNIILLTDMIMGLKMTLDYTGRSLHSCCNGLFSSIDTIFYTGSIDFDQHNPDLYAEITVQQKNKPGFELLCALQLPQDCGQHQDDMCSCVSGNQTDNYFVNISFKADTIMSGALIRGEIHENEITSYSNIKILPLIYDYYDKCFLLNVNGEVIDESHCLIKVTDSEINVTFKCADSLPSPCSLSILNAQTQTELKKGERIIEFSIEESQIQDLNFTYTFGHSNTYGRGFSCHIEDDDVINEHKQSSVVIVLIITNVFTFLIVLMTMLYYLKRIYQRYNNKGPNENEDKDSVELKNSMVDRRRKKKMFLSSVCIHNIRQDFECKAINA